MTTQNFKPSLAPRNKFQLSVPAEKMGAGERFEERSNSVARRKLFRVSLTEEGRWVNPLLLLFEGYVWGGGGVLTITAVVGAAMMNCTDRLSCDKCQIHFYTTVPGEWSILISMQLFHLEQNVLSSPAAVHRLRSIQ
jgi:hypothetical protein